MDSSFLSMYRSLYQWARAPKDIRKKILGLIPPEKNKDAYQYHSDEMTSEQNLLLNKIISSRDYFLLWGPPGTGKTSVMVKHLTRYLIRYTDEMICLVAYTNKAVDEMCKAVLDALEGETDLFIRIGSSFSCDPMYRPYLLDHAMDHFSRREEILSFLKQKRIIISTVSSLVNRTEIFHLFKMDTIIIDEASQILEPMIVGLLTQFRRFIMIGDHKQLPAVVVQDEKQTRIKSDELKASGFSNTRNSLFERLYMQALEKGWKEIIGILNQQGRMHQDIMEFSNRQFYEGRLQVIPGIERLIQPSDLKIPDVIDESKWERRMVFVNTDVEEDFSWKTNSHEVSSIIQLLKDIDLIYEANGMEWSTHSVGIITPYRAQISLISKHIIESLPKERAEMISIDTVERFQGGARDIIIISLCTNRMDQMERLVSLSDEGIDRKLNVALTRARDRVFIFGNKEIMVQDENYASLIDHTYTISSSS
jgi:DNA replication ATP-dependent helicase Dna2